MSSSDTQQDRWSTANPTTLIRGPIFIGLFIVLLFFGLFGGWASTANISSAVVAAGIISPEGSRKTVQHLEGGIIAEILVNDGDEVNTGDPLVVLQGTQARASFKVLEGQRRLLAAKISRLLAEQMNKPKVKFQDWLLTEESSAPEVQEILEAQRDLFATRNEVHQGRKAIGQKRVDELNEEIAGRKSQLSSQQRQLDLLEEELVAKKQLVEEGMIPRPEYLVQERMKAELEANIAENIASTARAKQNIGEIELQIVNEDSRRMDEIVNELAESRSELASVEERLYAQRDVLDRTVITAPVAGIIVQKRFHTTGGVVGPGQPILDIVPKDAELLIDTRVRPVDIDEIAQGQTARVHFLAFIDRRLPQIEGIVKRVSPDALVDEITGNSYYKAQVEVPPAELAKLGEEARITAGMPADVLIVTGERTLMEYLIQPIKDSMRRTFRES